MSPGNGVMRNGHARHPAPVRIASIRLRRILRGLLHVTIAGLLCIPASRLNGQTVSGDVVAAEDSTPVIGALVILFDAEGRRQAAAVTDSVGRYALRARTPGSYTLRVERIGFASVESPVLQLGAGGARHAFAMPSRAVALPEITAQSESRCRQRDDGEALYGLWEEVRKALELTDLTRERTGIRYTLVAHLREVDAAHQYVLREERRPNMLSSIVPYSAPATPEELVEAGFLELTEDDPAEGVVLLHGPDAEVLLSDVFADSYCYRVVAGESGSGEIGLGFEPSRRRRDVTDVQGVLWVDRATAELRRLDFSYVGLPAGLPARDMGGEVHFARLRDGGWIVSEWWIRSPLRAIEADRGTSRVIGHRHAGGSVVAARRGSEVLYDRRGTGTITGRATDLFLEGPARGATVGLSGTPHATAVDSAGTFRLDGIPPGRYALTITTDWMTELRTPGRMDSVVVTADEVVRRDLATPDFTNAMRLRCPNTPTGDPLSLHGVIYGVVHDPESGEPLAGVTVRAQHGRRTRDVMTDRAGRYAFCWVPRRDDEPTLLRIWTRQYRTERVPVMVREHIVRHDFH